MRASEDLGFTLLSCLGASAPHSELCFLGPFRSHGSYHIAQAATRAANRSATEAVSATETQSVAWLGQQQFKSFVVILTEGMLTASDGRCVVRAVAAEVVVVLLLLLSAVVVLLLLAAAAAAHPGGEVGAAAALIAATEILTNTSGAHSSCRRGSKRNNQNHNI